MQEKKGHDADLTEISLRGQVKLERHPHCPPLGVKINFRDEQPLHFYMGVLPGITHKYRNINSDDFGGHLVLRLENQERNIRTKDRHVTGLEIAKIVYHLFYKLWDHVRIKS